MLQTSDRLEPLEPDSRSLSDARAEKGAYPMNDFRLFLQKLLYTCSGEVRSESEQALKSAASGSLTAMGFRITLDQPYEAERSTPRHGSKNAEPGRIVGECGFAFDAKERRTAKRAASVLGGISAILLVGALVAALYIPDGAYVWAFALGLLFFFAGVSYAAAMGTFWTYVLAVQFSPISADETGGSTEGGPARAYTVKVVAGRIRSQNYSTKSSRGRSVLEVGANPSWMAPLPSRVLEALDPTSPLRRDVSNHASGTGATFRIGA